MTTLATGLRYPVLINGNPADPATSFSATNGNIDVGPLEGVVYAIPRAVGETTLTATLGAATGSVDVTIEPGPLDISFGIGEPA